MCTHFAGRGERSAVNVQIIGIVNNMLVLLQVGFHLDLKMKDIIIRT